MNFKLRIQNIVIFFTALVITACVSLIFGYFYAEIKNIPTLNSSAETDIIAMCGNSAVYASQGYTDIQVKEILMNISMNKFSYIKEGVKYDISVEEYKNKDNNKIIKLMPSVKIDNYYKIMLLFIVSVFIIMFGLVNFFFQNHNIKNITNPIIKLKKETEKLSRGDLDEGIIEEGYDEIKELGKAIEILRIKLKESVYYKEKYDENRNFLISSISHDLKTPVTSIKGYIEGILDGVANTPEKQEDYLKKAAYKTVLITNMIDDLLLYSKLDLNQIPFDLEKTDLVEYMKYSVDDNLIEFSREGKKISMENAPLKAFVTIDRNRFRRVVQNVLDNAKKHIENETGEVIIKMRETARAVIIEFKDNGKGIKKEELPNIFDRFYRGDATRQNSGSSGLGLAIAKLIVEAHDGRIWAVSEEGCGTSIMISLKKIMN